MNRPLDYYARVTLLVEALCTGRLATGLKNNVLKCATS